MARDQPAGATEIREHFGHVGQTGRQSDREADVDEMTQTVTQTLDNRRRKLKLMKEHQGRLHHINDGANDPWKKYKGGGFCTLFQELRGR